MLKIEIHSHVNGEVLNVRLRPPRHLEGTDGLSSALLKEYVFLLFLAKMMIRQTVRQADISILPCPINNVIFHFMNVFVIHLLSGGELGS